MAKAKEKEEVVKTVPMVCGAIYEVDDAHGEKNTVQCISVSHKQRKRVGQFCIQGYVPEFVEEGTERAQQFRLIWKPSAKE
jgi:hypothetical protein